MGVYKGMCKQCTHTLWYQKEKDTCWYLRKIGKPIQHREEGIPKVKYDLTPYGIQPDEWWKQMEKLKKFLQHTYIIVWLITLWNWIKVLIKEISKIYFSKKKEWSNTHYLTTNFGIEDEPDIIKKHNLNLVDEEIKKTCERHTQSQVGSHYSFLPYTRTSWFSLFKKGNYAHIHRHGFSDISGVYYYRTNGSDGDIFFETPVTETACSKFWMDHAFTFSNRTRKRSNFTFPGWLSHGVRTNTTDNSRISLSFNIKLQN